jgi:hypothetical protein
MGKWLGILLAVMLAAAILGFLVDAVGVIAGLLFVACVVTLIARALLRSKRSSGTSLRKGGHH